MEIGVNNEQKTNELCTSATDCNGISVTERSFRAILRGGVSVNDVKVTDFAKVFTSADFDEDGVLLIKKGKKGYHQVKAD